MVLSQVPPVRKDDHGEPLARACGKSAAVKAATPKKGFAAKGAVTPAAAPATAPSAATAAAPTKGNAEAPAARPRSRAVSSETPLAGVTHDVRRPCLGRPAARRRR
jgi:hypothetical protein